MSALHSLEHAIRDLSLAALERLFNQNAHTEFRGDDVLPNGRPPTIYAMERMYAKRTSEIEFLDHIIRAGWTLISPLDDHDGATALHALVNIASSNYNVDHLFAPIAEYLTGCEQLADIDAPDCRANDGRTPLHWAASITINNWKPAVPTLLANGADPNQQDKNGSTPLHYAAANWSLDRVHLMVQYGADPTVRNHSGNSPIDEATLSKDRTTRGKADAQRIIDYLTSL